MRRVVPAGMALRRYQMLVGAYSYLIDQRSVLFSNTFLSTNLYPKLACIHRAQVTHDRRMYTVLVIYLATKGAELHTQLKKQYLKATRAPSGVLQCSHLILNAHKHIG